MVAFTLCFLLFSRLIALQPCCFQNSVNDLEYSELHRPGFFHGSAFVFVCGHTADHFQKLNVGKCVVLPRMGTFKDYSHFTHTKCCQCFFMTDCKIIVAFKQPYSTFFGHVNPVFNCLVLNCSVV
jgi:hypothetical protein